MADGVLSIKTTMPRDGGVNIYNDQLTDDGYYQYSLQAGDPRRSGNKCLWQAYESKQPFIYFHAIAPAVYKALWPCFVDSIFPEEGHARILVGIAKPGTNIRKFEYSIPDNIESRYMVRESKVRLHQAAFRSAILDVYQNRCAVTGMVEPKLIDAAHIIPDAEVGESQLINNGIALSNLHHRAYDRGLIGIDPDYRVYVSDRILDNDENRFVQSAFKGYDQKKLYLPKSVVSMPNKDSLAKRFEYFIK
jgi:putative restriction endonuclease